jgi:hypothetical protein
VNGRDQLIDQGRLSLSAAPNNSSNQKPLGLLKYAWLVTRTMLKAGRNNRSRTR